MNQDATRGRDRLRWMGLGVLVLSITGCTLLTGPHVEVLPARIDIDSPYLHVPDSIGIGVPFVLSLPTHDRKCDTELSVEIDVGQQVVVRPMESVMWDRSCFTGGVIQLQEIEIVWPNPGSFMLIIVGVDRRDDPVALRYTVFASE